MNTTLSGINPKTGNTLIADIRNASKTPENPVEASIQSLIKRAPSRDALLFVRHVKPFDWYVTGVVYTDEASAPGKQLSFLLIAAILEMYTATRISMELKKDTTPDGGGEIADV